jgi:uncharacterized protein (TIGR03435 family)
MQPTHEPHGEFVERLEAHIVREVQRHNRAMTGRGRMHLFFKPAFAFAAVAVTVAFAVGATIVWRTADAALFHIVEGASRDGDTVRSHDTGAVIALSDGSRVEMRSSSELAVERAPDGIRIRLDSGGIIVNAAKQRSGHLYVQTKDMTVSVVGTVFLVNADPQGSRVAVIEGEVRVHQGNVEQTLLPGDQLATNAQMPSSPVIEEIAWSRNLGALIDSLTRDVHRFADERGRDDLARLLGELAAAPVQSQGARDASAFRPADTPKWEAISVRPCASDVRPGARGTGAGGQGGGVRMDPSFLRVECMDLRYLIEDAYVKYLEPGAFRRRWIFPVTGGPDWLDSDLYSIDARPVNPPVDRQTMGGPMLQVLLEERFKLKLRREVRQEPVYELRVAEGGFKLQPLKDGECEARVAPLAGLTGLARLERTMEAVVKGQACGAVRIANGPARTVSLDGSPVYDLTNYLSLDRIILDKTGIQGVFDISVTYGADVSPMGNRNRTAAADTPDVPPTQSPRVPSGADPVFDALRKQLGLELVPTMGPRIHYFVEHVERPTPN